MVLYYHKSPFLSLKIFVTETLDENFSSENFLHLKFFFTEKFQKEILAKIFHNKSFKSEI